MQNRFEKSKQEAVKRIKSLLGDFGGSSDIEIAIYTEEQLEKILISMTLNNDYSNGIKKYTYSELPRIYFKIKEAYKDFDMLRWITLVYQVMETHEKKVR